jgi:hypothetical protein
MLVVDAKNTYATANGVKPSFSSSVSVKDSRVTFNVANCVNVGYAEVNDVANSGRVGYMIKVDSGWTYTFDNESPGEHVYLVMAHSYPIGSSTSDQAVIETNSTRQYVSITVGDNNVHPKDLVLQPSFTVNTVVSGANITLGITDGVNISEASVFDASGENLIGKMSGSGANWVYEISDLSNGDYVYKVVATNQLTKTTSEAKTFARYVTATIYQAPLPTTAERVKYDTNEYGRSGKDRPLKVISIEPGDGVIKSKILAVFEIHGFEDAYARDGQVLVDIGNEVAKYFFDNPEKLNGHALYIVSSANPDGLADGWTNNGPGRCQISKETDINRDFGYCWCAKYCDRYKTSAPFSTPESRSLRDLVINVQPNDVVDIHGWLSTTYGDSSLTRYFRDSLGIGYSGGLCGASGYFSAWAMAYADRTSLIELSSPYVNHQAVIDAFVSLCAAS